MVADAWKNYWCCSDGDGGVIIFWLDKRDSYIQCGEPVCVTYSNSLYIQRVDKNGNKMWGDDGILVSGADEGLKQARITPDREGGCALLYSEERFVYPGADSINYLKIARYNQDGDQVWKTVLDSNKIWSNGFGLYSIARGGEFYYLGYSNYYKVIKNTGDISTFKRFDTPLLITSQDNQTFFINEYSFTNYIAKVTKIGSLADTIWTKSVSYIDFCPDAGAGGLIPDNIGGAYLTHVCSDSLIYFDSLGQYRYKKFNGIGSSGQFYPDGNNGILLRNTNMARRFDSTGTMIWPETVTFISDPENSYSELYVSDNNGGIIAVYWSTLGGIYAQHTGRYGELGVVVGVDEPGNDTPQDFTLYQNYPNPFNPTTTIKYTIPSVETLNATSVQLKIFNLLGQEVATLVNKQQPAGEYSVKFDASDLSSGVYIYKMQVGQFMDSKKMLLIK